LISGILFGSKWSELLKIGQRPLLRLEVDPGFGTSR
jgi:hypothetical protein